MNTELISRIAAAHTASAAHLPAHIVHPAQRQAALQRLLTQGLPTTRHENWRYTNLRALDHAGFVPAATTAKLTAAALPPLLDGYTRYTFVDGVFAPALSSTMTPPGGAPIDLGAQNTSANSVAQPIDTAFALLNDAFATDSARFTAADTPLRIEVLFVATAPAATGASYPRLELRAQPRAKVELIERHLSVGDSAAGNLVVPVVTFDIGANATVDHYRIQQIANTGTWLDTVRTRVMDHAAYRLYLINLGAATARSTVHIELSGPRAQLAMHAVSVADKHQTQDVFAEIDHCAPETLTEQNFRGIAASEARLGFNGRIVVRDSAKRAQSRQSLRGLLAGAAAEIAVRPQLEIYTDEVQCSHGATTGKLDDNMLFYLLSRGIDRETAQSLLKWAFLEDVMSKIGIPALRRQIERSAAGQLNDATALQELL